MPIVVCRCLNQFISNFFHEHIIKKKECQFMDGIGETNYISYKNKVNVNYRNTLEYRTRYTV